MYLSYHLRKCISKLITFIVILIDTSYFLRNNCLRTDRQVNPCFHDRTLLQMVMSPPSPRPHGRGHPRMVFLVCPAATHKLRALKPERDSTNMLIHNRRADCLFVICLKTCAPKCTGKFPALPALPGSGAQAARPGSRDFLGFRTCLRSQGGKSDRRGACCIGGMRISSPYVSATQNGQTTCSDLRRTSAPCTLIASSPMQAGRQTRCCRIS